MRFEEAEQKYRELEASLVSGELKEDDFLISQIPVYFKMKGSYTPRIHL